MKFLAGFIFVTSALFANKLLAKYDPVDCVSNPMMEMAGLQCVSCGLTKYYSDKGEEIDPSHKWIVLQAIKARMAARASGNSKLNSDDSKVAMQKSVINQIQTYGFCKEYLGKTTKKNGRSKNYHDISAEEWKFFNNFLNRPKSPDKKAEIELAEKFGFRNPGFFSNETAKENMNFFFEGTDENLPVSGKRELFSEKIKVGLTPDYNASGERNEKPKDYIGADDKDEGLRACLADLKKRFYDTKPTDQDSFAMCESMASACDIQRDPRDSKSDFCQLNGLEIRSSAPRAAGNGNSNSSSGTNKGQK